jgi:hypothetical protein
MGQEPPTEPAAAAAPAQELADYGPHQLADRVGLYRRQVERARDLGLLPAPDVDGARWSATVVDDIAGRVEEIRASLDVQQAWGASRCAQRLAEAAGVPVEAADIEVLAQRGLLHQVDEYKGYPLYRVGDVDALAERENEAGTLATVVAERQAWMAASLDLYAAAAQLGWRYDSLETAVAAAGIAPGRFGRFAIADLDALAADEEFIAGRLLGPEQAAAHLDVRRVDFEHAVVAGWIAAARYSAMHVGRSSVVQVPLYRQGDVDALLTIPEVDWNDVRDVRPGQPSKLREWVRRPPTRAQIIRRMAADLGTRFGVEVWAFFNAAAGRWEIDWESIDGQPTREQVAEAVAADPVATQYRKHMQLSTVAGAAVRWARAMLEPGAAVILDTETTDLFDAAIVEIAVIDACTGATLLDTLVRADRPIQPGARAVHGISDADLADAPVWADVLPKLLAVTENRQVLCYNAFSLLNGRVPIGSLPA